MEKNIFKLSALLFLIFYSCSSSVQDENLKYYSEYIELYENEIGMSGSQEQINEYKEMSLKYYEIIKNSLDKNIYSSEQIKEFNELTNKAKEYEIISKK